MITSESCTPGGLGGPAELDRDGGCRRASHGVVVRGGQVRLGLRRDPLAALTFPLVGAVGKPVTAVPGLSPTDPVIVVGPVFVIADPARIAKFAALPHETDCQFGAGTGTVASSLDRLTASSTTRAGSPAGERGSTSGVDPGAAGGVDPGAAGESERPGWGPDASRRRTPERQRAGGRVAWSRPRGEGSLAGCAVADGDAPFEAPSTRPLLEGPGVTRRPRQLEPRGGVVREEQRHPEQGGEGEDPAAPAFGREGHDDRQKPEKEEPAEQR